jgi:hypothetical protein
MDRCYNKNSRGYRWYGNRGIKVCEKWKNDSSEFIKWALKNGWNEKLTIDRIDSDGHYEPKNCRFVPQRRNVLSRDVKNKTGYPGITKRADYASNEVRYRARIEIDGKVVNIGTFRTAREANDARQAYIKKHKLVDWYR